MSLRRRSLAVGAAGFAHASAAAVILVLGLEMAVRLTPLPPIGKATVTSRVVTGASGEILWAFRAADDRWRLPIDPGKVDRRYLDLLLAVEDRRFDDHRGVDLPALARAGWQALLHGRPVSGASTLTMQLVRLLEPRPRTLANKLGEILAALRLERTLPKQDILRLYLTLAPYGGNLEGLRAASLVLLGKEPNRLSLAEAALLVAIPQAPEARRPDRHRDAARAARNRILAAAISAGRLPVEGARSAAASPVATGWHPLTRLAPHLAMRLRAASPEDDAPIATLIEPALQAHLEAIARRAIRDWGTGVSLAAIVIRNRDGAVTGYLGGAELGSEDRKGFVDLVGAVRSPGSALKPFVYAMAFERLIVHPETVITDRPIDIDGYRPDNADGHFAGDLTVRQALIRSRNTTAVQLLDRIGIPAFLARFRTAGRPLRLSDSEGQAGLAIALGGAGVSLEQLTWFYTALAGEGRLWRLRLQAGDAPGRAGDLLTPAAARATADILGDVPPPPGFARPKAADGGRRIAFKTGTSYGFRDAWAVGFDRLHTVGVWVGRPDGAAHLGAYGASVAAPILLRIFDGLPVPDEDVSPARIALGGMSGLRDLPERLRRFPPPRSDLRDGQTPLEIIFPKPGAELAVDRQGRAAAPLPLALSGGRSPFTWTVNGLVQPPTTASTLVYPVDGRGQFEVTVADAAGTLARSSFWLR